MFWDRARLFALLIAAASVACSDSPRRDPFNAHDAGSDGGNEPLLRAAAAYTPADALMFGDVAVHSEKTLNIAVLNSGTAVLKISSAAVAADPEKWRISVMPELLTGIASDVASSIAVTYRPCPAAWETRVINGEMVDVLREGFNFTTCPIGMSDSTKLTIEELETDDGRQELMLSARAVERPSAAVFCQNGPLRECNANAPAVEACVSMSFGEVVAGDTPCGLVVEIRNTQRGSLPTAALAIEGIEIEVQNIEDEVTSRGEEAGFTVHALDGAPLEPTPANPFLVNIPNGMQEGRERFVIQFSGIAPGTWDGRTLRSMTGVKLYTSDPDHRVLTFAINGTGAAPDLDWQPRFLDFGPVLQGATKVRTATVVNSGNAPLVISAISFQNDQAGDELTYTTSRGAMFPIELGPSERMQIVVTYRPTGSGTDEDQLIITNNDLRENNRVAIPLSGGPTPRLRVDPPDVLPMPIEEMSSSGRILISNVGYGDLVVQSMSITGPNGDPLDPSVDDFYFADDCPNPCTNAVTLCPPSSGSCASSEVVELEYLNNDTSALDYAELHIFSSDPTDAEHIVVLSAELLACSPPIASITYTPAMPCKGQPVTASGAMSDPGGGMLIVSYNWQWLFTPGIAPPFVPPNAVDTTFIPGEAGAYVLGLGVQNDCGALSTSPATETLMVADTCP